MKKFVSTMFLLSIFFWAAISQNLPKLPKENINIMVSSDMGCRGVSEQKNIADIMGRFADQNRIDFLAVAGAPIHNDGVKSVDDEEWNLKIENIYTAPSLHAFPWYVVSGNHEYMKDGLLSLTERLEKSPWSERMLEILDDLDEVMPLTPEAVTKRFSYIEGVEVNDDLLQVLSRMYWMTGNKKYLEFAGTIFPFPEKNRYFYVFTKNK